MEEDLKPIIVDGVDVSRCNCLGVKLTKKHMCICDSIDFCNEEPNCYYKQLQREKQNSQEARDTAIKEFNRAEKLKMLLKRKEQECEKLKQTLTEIKPILELYANSKIGEEQLDGTYKITVKNSSVLGDTYITFDPRPAKQALQKISECEVENER